MPRITKAGPKKSRERKSARRPARARAGEAKSFSRLGAPVRKLLEREDGVGVVPTDTIYGISARAFAPKAIARIYDLRKRDLKKPMIVLISSLDDMELFGVKLRPAVRSFLAQYWPGKISIVLNCPSRKFFYLHRGTNSLAFRMPDREDLRKLIRAVGPLVSTSANFEGMPPASNISQARRYFGDKVDFYVDAGPLMSLPSTLIGIRRGKITVLREGAVRITP